MGNGCSCYEKDDEIELNTKTNLLKLKKIKLDSSFKKEMNLNNQEPAKENLSLKVMKEGEQKKNEDVQKLIEAKNLEKVETIDSNSSNCN